MKIKYIFGLALATTLFASCSEDMLDSINEREASKTADKVAAKFQLTDAEVATAYSTVNGSYAWYVSSYTEQLFGTGNNQLKNAELRNANETAASTTFNNEWNATYSNLYNINQMIQKCSEGGINSDQTDILGIAQILYALNWGILTDLHGDIPFSECFKGSAAKIDSQEEIYKAIFQLLDDAQTNLAAGGSHAGDQDLVYGGDTEQWAAFGHAVKARYLLHTAGRNNAVLSQVVTEAQAAVDGGFDGFAVDVFNGVTADNSWSAYHWSRYYIASSTTVDDLMETRKDPRQDIYASPLLGVVCAPGDQEMAMATIAGEGTTYPAWLDNGAAPLNIFSKAELYFILAEAKARLGQDASAEFQEGVKASMDWYNTINDDLYAAYGMDNVSDDEVTAYLAAIDPLFQANPLKEILIQKYLAQAATEQLETYNDIRRVRYMDGANAYPVELKNPNNTSSSANRWPLRLPYGESDVVSNPNVAAVFGSGNDAGVYIFTENVWWAGGSR